ncbi:FAD-binding protein [Glutamicibacter mysorens]|uniref:FAD-binding protein n=1 Tax=Glutamicibacter mysorens TaxID=257984 RepID=UPI00346446AB
MGGSTARSGGAFWIPANPVLKREGAGDSLERGEKYIASVVEGSGPAERWKAFLEYGDETVKMLERMTQLSFFWAKGYCDYHPEEPGGRAAGRSVESRPFDLNKLGGQAIAGGMYAGALGAGIPVWTEAKLVDLEFTDSAVTGAILEQGGERVSVRAKVNHGDAIELAQKRLFPDEGAGRPGASVRR